MLFLLTLLSLYAAVVTVLLLFHVKHRRAIRHALRGQDICLDCGLPNSKREKGTCAGCASPKAMGGNWMKV